jgi:oligopeptidase B
MMSNTARRATGADARPNRRPRALRTFVLVCSVAWFTACSSPESEIMQAPANISRPAAPVAEQRPHEIEAHGEVRIDPYYWLRDDSRQDPAVLAYLNAENSYTQAVLAHTQDVQQRLFEELVGRIRQDDASVPYRLGEWWYYRRYEAGREHPIFARRKGSIDGPEQVMLDVNELAAAHDFYQVGALSVSQDSRWLAFVEDTVSRGEWTLRIKDLDTGEMLADRIDNVSTSLAWADDNETLFYVRQQADTLIPYQAWRHVRGSEPDAGTLIYEETDPQFYMALSRSRSDEQIIIYSLQTVSTEARMVPVDRPEAEPVVVLPRERDHEYMLEPVGDTLWIRSNWQGENFRLLRAPLERSADKSTWEEVIGHRDTVMIEDFAVFDDYLVLEERTGGMLKIRVIPFGEGDEFYIDSDEGAFTAELGINPSMDTSILRYQYSSMATPDSVYDYDMATGERTLLKQEEVVGDFDPDNYITERIYAPARDGAQVPVTLLYRRGVSPDGDNPLFVYGYGSYGISIDPTFGANRLSLVDRGFVYAIAHIRGGEELGRQWYERGKLLHKHNTFNDFIDVTEHLVAEGWGNAEKVVVTGRSAGGLLMGAVVNMRPDLFTAAIVGVPFVDVVTTMLDESIPLTTFEYDEWGNPNDPEFYRAMLAYSPYDNVAVQDYPHIYIGTGLWDPAVQYWEPAKWVARLRERKTDDNLLLLYTDMSAGHGGQSGRFERLRDTAREFAFIFEVLGIEP